MLTSTIACLDMDLPYYTCVRLYRSSSQAPQEATMLQLNEELAYVHQASAFCQDMRDRLATHLVCHASAHAITDAIALHQLQAVSVIAH